MAAHTRKPSRLGLGYSFGWVEVSLVAGTLLFLVFLMVFLPLILR